MTCIASEMVKPTFHFDDLVVPPLSLDSPFQARISFTSAGSSSHESLHPVRLGTDAEYREHSLPRPDFLKHAHIRPLDPKNPSAGYLLTGAVPWDNKTFNVLFVHDGQEQKTVTNYRVVLSDSTASIVRDQLQPKEVLPEHTSSLSGNDNSGARDAHVDGSPPKQASEGSPPPLAQNQYRVQIGDTLEFILGRMVTDGRDFEEVVRAFRGLNPDVWQPDGMSLRVGSIVKLPFPMKSTNPTYAARVSGGSFSPVSSQKVVQVAQSVHELGRTIPSIPERRGGSSSPTIENPKGREAVIRAIKEEIKADKGGWPQNAVAETPAAAEKPRMADAQETERLAQSDTDFQYQQGAPSYAPRVNVQQSPAYVITREEIYLALLMMVALTFGYNQLKKRSSHVAGMAVPPLTPSPPPSMPEYQRPPPIPEQPRDPPSTTNSQKLFEAGFEAGFKSGVTAPSQMSLNQTQSASPVAPAPMGVPAHPLSYPYAVAGAGYPVVAPVPVSVAYPHSTTMLQMPQHWGHQVHPTPGAPMAPYGMTATDAAGYVMTAYGPIHASQFAALNQAPMGLTGQHPGYVQPPAPFANATMPAPQHPVPPPHSGLAAGPAPTSTTQVASIVAHSAPQPQDFARGQEAQVAAMMQTPQPQAAPIPEPVRTAPSPVSPRVEPAPAPAVARPTPSPTIPSSPAPAAPPQPMAEMAGAAKEASKKRNARDERLDLARVYINMGDRETAKLLLRQIIDAGKPADKEEAFKIFEKINAPNFPKNMGVGEEVG